MIPTAMNIFARLDLTNLTREQREVFAAMQKRVVDLEGNLAASNDKLEQLEDHVADLEQLNARLEQLNARQESLIRELQAALFGKSSEKLSEDERQFAAEDLEVALGEVESEAGRGRYRG